MKTIAMPVVKRVKKLPAPLLPKMVELEPPKTAPISAPLPVCSSTTRISPTLTMTCKTVIAMIINSYFFVNARTIGRKVALFRLAPPTRKPSISATEPKLSAFSGLTLPPYKIRT